MLQLTAHSDIGCLKGSVYILWRNVTRMLMLCSHALAFTRGTRQKLVGEFHIITTLRVLYNIGEIGGKARLTRALWQVKVYQYGGSRAVSTCRSKMSRVYLLQPLLPNNVFMWKLQIELILVPTICTHERHGRGCPMRQGAASPREW